MVNKSCTLFNSLNMRFSSENDTHFSLLNKYVYTYYNFFNFICDNININLLTKEKLHVHTYFS